MQAMCRLLRREWTQETIRGKGSPLVARLAVRMEAVAVTAEEETAAVSGLPSQAEEVWVLVMAGKVTAGVVRVQVVTTATAVMAP